MSSLVKAQLQEVKADQNQTVEGSAIPVQFNPASLRLKLTNQSSGGRSRGRQARQNNGQSSSVLSMDLIFDSADEGTADGEPVSVREKTNRVERFVLPKEDTSDAPPLLRFEWDKIIIVGIVESLDINFEHFAENGAPLRAKMSLSIKEQEPGYAYLEIGKGKKESAGSGKTKSDRSDTALDGETAPDFLARKGLDPAAWRGLDVDLSAGLSLEAGIEVGFSANIGVGLGIGVSAGVMAEAGVSLEASLGIGASAVLSAGAGASSNATSIKKVDANSAGKALSAAGGIQSAIETVKINETQAVSTEAQSAFGIQVGDTTSSNSTVSKISYSPLLASQQTSANGKQRDAGASKISVGTTAPPKVDPRAASYGYGVPLQPLYAAALTQKQLRLCPRNDNGLRGDNGPRFRKQRTTSPWEALPQRDNTRTLADQTELVRVSQKRKCGPG